MLGLTEKHRPHRISEFAGLKVAKAMMAKLASNPWPSAWLFIGDSGTGKTALALALAEEMNAELHHIAAAQCNLENVENVCRACYYAPMFGGDFHLVLVDEADRMSAAAQVAFLSRLDATGFPPKTIFIFTCNGADKLEPRFKSRCRTIQFDGGAESQDVANFLFSVWYRETGGKTSGAPVMRDLIVGNGGNIRGALMAMEMELLVQECAA